MLYNTYLYIFEILIYTCLIIYLYIFDNTYFHMLGNTYLYMPENTYLYMLDNTYLFDTSGPGDHINDYTYCFALIHA